MYNKSIAGLSPEAKKLVELCGHDGKNVSEVLKTNPELFVGLNGYIKWRDDENRAIKEERQTPPIGHNAKDIIKSLMRKRKK